jgi:hypothetical protein
LPVRFKVNPDAGWLLWVSCMLAAVLIVIEGHRWISKPVLSLDGLEIGVVEPFPATQYRERHLKVIKSTD